MSKSERRSRRLAFLTLPLTAILLGCATQAPTAATKPADTPPSAACAAFSRISFSRLHDTDDTIRQVKAYDAARDVLCGPGK